MFNNYINNKFNQKILSQFTGENKKGFTKRLRFLFWKSTSWVVLNKNKIIT